MNERIGVFGGSFDPVHNGHIAAMTDVAKKIGLDRVFAVPAFQNPLKGNSDLTPANHRVEMLKCAIEGYEDTISLDLQEVEREGPSYAVETVDGYASQYGAENVNLILGADTFEHFDEWKNFEDILSKSNLIVVSRPGGNLPREASELPSGLIPLVEIYDASYVELKTGRHIQFVEISEIPISSTVLRKRLRSSRNVSSYLPIKVEQYLKEQKLYEPLGDRLGDTKDFLKFLSKELETRRAIATKVFDLSGLNAPSDYAIVASGTSARHAKAIGEYVFKEVKHEFGVMPLSVEGMQEGRWVLIDYGAIIVHVFYDFVRGEYNLEELWSKGQEITEEIVAQSEN